MVGYLFMSLIYIIPIAAIVFFIVSLCDYIGTKKKYVAEPNDFNEQKKKETKTRLMVASIIMGVLLTVIVGFVVMMYMAIAYM